MCNLTDICEAQSPCDNGICILLSQPDEYFCNCTGTGFNGPNCSSSGKLRNYTCDIYMIVLTNVTVLTLDMWESETVLLCNEHGIYIVAQYFFLYLAVCGLSCEPGYVLDSSCSMCVLINICEVETPCDNNGECILGSQHDEYTCNCTNTGYTGTNCTGMFCSSV